MYGTPTLQLSPALIPHRSQPLHGLTPARRRIVLKPPMQGAELLPQVLARRRAFGNEMPQLLVCLTQFDPDLLLRQHGLVTEGR